MKITRTAFALIATSLPSGVGIPVGQPAPDAGLHDADGHEIRLHDLFKAGPVTQATYEIPFPVLSDPDRNAHRAYRVIHQVDETEFGRLTGSGIDLERASGRPHHIVPLPSLFLIDRDGFVRWAHADPDCKVRPSIEQILAAIDAADVMVAP